MEEPDSSLSKVEVCVGFPPVQANSGLYLTLNLTAA